MIKKFFIFFTLFIFSLFLISCNRNISKEDSNKLYLSALDAYSSENYTESLVYLEILKKNNNKYYQADLLKGKILFFQKDYESSLKIFNKLIKKYPNFYEAKIWYIRDLIILKNYQEAKKQLDIELSFNQTDWRIYYLYSVLEDATDNIDQKIIMLNRAELALTDSAKIYMELSDIMSILDLKETSNDYLLKAKIVAGSNTSLTSLQNAINNNGESIK